MLNAKIPTQGSMRKQRWLRNFQLGSLEASYKSDSVFFLHRTVLCSKCKSLPENRSKWCHDMKVKDNHFLLKTPRTHILRKNPLLFGLLPEVTGTVHLKIWVLLERTKMILNVFIYKRKTKSQDRRYGSVVKHLHSWEPPFNSLRLKKEGPER